VNSGKKKTDWLLIGLNSMAVAVAILFGALAVFLAHHPEYRNVFHHCARFCH
jgi:hypothetical protein